MMRRLDTYTGFTCGHSSYPGVDGVYSTNEFNAPGERAVIKPYIRNRSPNYHNPGERNMRFYVQKSSDTAIYT